MRQLLDRPKRNWKYLVNLAGTELPAVTTAEIRAKIQRHLPDGRSIVESFPNDLPEWILKK